MKHHRRGKEVLNYGLARAVTPKPNSEAGGMAPNTVRPTGKQGGEKWSQRPLSFADAKTTLGTGLITCRPAPLPTCRIRCWALWGQVPTCPARSPQVKLAQSKVESLF